MNWLGKFIGQCGLRLPIPNRDYAVVLSRYLANRQIEAVSVEAINIISDMAQFAQLTRMKFRTPALFLKTFSALVRR